MEQFLENPNLPEGQVTLCAVSEGFSEVAGALRDMGVKVWEIPPSKILQGVTASHGDIRIHHLGGGEILLSKPCEDLRAAIESHGFHGIHTYESLQDKYPGDVLVNAARIGNRLFANLRWTDRRLLEYCQEHGLLTADVKQGYAKCSICIVDKNSIITDDPSIGKKAVQLHYDVLQVSHGDILLDGYPYGFIGGCCGLISPHRMVWTGNLDTHRDGERIIQFLQRHQIEPVFLRNDNLVDVGSLLPLKEMVHHEDGEIAESNGFGSATRTNG